MDTTAKIILGVAAVIYFLGRSIPAANIRKLRLIDFFKGRSRAGAKQIPIEAEVVDDVN